MRSRKPESGMDAPGERVDPKCDQRGQFFEPTSNVPHNSDRNGDQRGASLECVAESQNRAWTPLASELTRNVTSAVSFSSLPRMCRTIQIGMEISAGPHLNA